MFLRAVSSVRFLAYTHTESRSQADIFVYVHMAVFLLSLNQELKGFVCVLSHFDCVRLFATLWTIAHQALLCMGFSRREYWRGLPRPPPGDLSDPGIKLASPVSPALAGGFFITTTTWEAQKLLVPTCDLHRQWSWTLTAHQNHLENVYRISMAGSYLAESC